MKCERIILRDYKDENEILYSRPPSHPIGMGEEICGGKLKVRIDIDNDEENRSHLEFDIFCEVCNHPPYHYNINDFLTEVLAKI